jgi:hypothetical protein
MIAYRDNETDDVRAQMFSRCMALAEYYRAKAERHDADARHCRKQAELYEQRAARENRANS